VEVHLIVGGELRELKRLVLLLVPFQGCPSVQQAILEEAVYHYHHHHHHGALQRRL
jgi:hypothetical protein